MTFVVTCTERKCGWLAAVSDAAGQLEELAMEPRETPRAFLGRCYEKMNGAREALGTEPMGYGQWIEAVVNYM